jgi:hypothetical protein
MWLIGLAGLAATSASAADVPRGANLLALGGTGAANPHDNAALALNPGLLGLVERYDFQAQFAYGPTNALQWGLNGMDGRNSALAGGFAYSGDRFEPRVRTEDLPGWREVGAEVRNRMRLHDLAVALALPLLDRRLAFGLSSAITWYNHDLLGKGVAFDLQGGVGVRPIDALTFGVAVRNFLPLRGGVDRPTSVVGGVRVEAPGISLGEPRPAPVAIEANAEWIPRQPPSLQDALPLVLSAGVELPLGAARIRAGGRRDVGGLAWVTAGLGYEREGTAVEYGVGIPTNPVLGPRQSALASTVHAIQIRFEAPPEELPPTF